MAHIFGNLSPHPKSGEKIMTKEIKIEIQKFERPTYFLLRADRERVLACSDWIGLKMRPRRSVNRRLPAEILLERVRADLPDTTIDDLAAAAYVRGAHVRMGKAPGRAPQFFFSLGFGGNGHRLHGRSVTHAKSQKRKIERE